MNQLEDVIFFVSESIRHAKTLPAMQMAAFLNGMRASLGDQHPLSEHLAARCRALYNNDAQLELIANGQLKLNLVESPKTRVARKKAGRRRK